MTTPPDPKIRLVEVPADVVAEAIRRKMWHEGLDVQSVGFYGENGELLDLGRIYVRAYPRQVRKAAAPSRSPRHFGRWLLWAILVILVGNALYAVLKNTL